MNKKEFTDLILKKVVILDGATGTELQKRGMPTDSCPEIWILENPDILIDLQKKYIKAGSDIIYAPTFGANKIKLKRYKQGDNVKEINTKLAELSKKAAGNKALVAGNLGPTGELLEPYGDLSYDEAVNVYKEQAQALIKGGIDLFIVETMMDIKEAKAALIAIKESSDLPVIISMTFDKTGRTIMGIDAKTAAIKLQEFGANAIGCNCSTGPQDMLKVIKELKENTNLPILAKPNAGIPELIDGETVFNMEAKEFADYAVEFVENGISFIGGCCGTTPEFIRKIYIKLI